ncbi:MAG: ComEC/Rec2 family competence protein [Patescibacteria group bacterium]
MPIHDFAFYSIIFFIIGVFLASLETSFYFILFAAFLTAALFLFFNFYFNFDKKLKLISLLSLIIILGAFYYNFYDAYQTKNIAIIFNQKIIFKGTIADYPERGSQQKLIVKLQKPFNGKILAQLKAYPAYNYGDLIEIEGIIKLPEPEDYKNYLKKDGISGIIKFPKINLISENHGSFAKNYLFKLKEEVVLNFQKTLPLEKAAFLSGITLGERAEFSPEFKENMAKSGTTHLVALSGYNITIVTIAIGAFFGYFLNKKITFWLTIITIIAFVIMTGAEASVVRAAIMGAIILLAKQIGRVHSVRNAIAVAAFIMILINPRVLSFDLGFQLSFLALIGIIYFSPIIEEFFKLREESGILGWRENFLATISAQAMALPLLLVNFESFSLTSVLANVLILGLIPITMFLGFLMAVFGFLSIHLATIIGWIANLFISYELLIIDIFSKFSISVKSIGISGLILYYLIIFAFILIFKLRTKK